jgi:hypothetical protein
MIFFRLFSAGHFVAGITWIGMLYFFNLINAHVTNELQPPMRREVVPQLMPRALWWFRWGAMFTFLSGLPSTGDVGRNREANLLSGFQIDDQRKLRRLFDRNVGGLRSFENLVNHSRDTPEAFGLVGSVGDQATAVNKISASVYRRQPIFYR